MGKRGKARLNRNKSARSITRLLIDAVTVLWGITIVIYGGSLILRGVLQAEVGYGEVFWGFIALGLGMVITFSKVSK